jgi:putative transcriptional regulator
MPIIVNLDVQLAKEKMSVAKLSERVGISIQNLHVLKSNRARAIRLTTLAVICDALNCQPGDLLQNVSQAEFQRLFPDHKDDDDDDID